MKNYFDNLEQAATEIHAANTAKGFWQPGVKRAISETVALAISELYEGLEAARAGKEKADVNGFRDNLIELGIDPENPDFTHPAYIDLFAATFRYTVKDTLPDELADAVIRILDLAAGHQLSLPALQAYFNKFKGAVTIEEGKLSMLEMILSTNSELLRASYDGGIQQVSYLAEALYNIWFYCEKNQINLNWHIHYKLLYNSTRGLKHGKSF